MKQLVWSRTARRELEALNDWLTELIRLLEHPQVGTMVPDSGYRKWRVRRTPCLVFFRATGAGIRVLKVRHVRSDRRR